LLQAVAALGFLLALAILEFPRGSYAVLVLIAAAAAASRGLVQHGARRRLWLAAAGLAALGFVVLVIRSHPALLLGLLITLSSGAAAGRAAFRVRVKLPPAPRPLRPVLFWNPRSGAGKAVRLGLADAARARGIEPIEVRSGVDLEQLVRQAVEQGADALAMAGGDGSQAVVARVAAERALPYACIPAGTRNHFALDLGLDRDDVVGALDAFSDATEQVIDLAEVNGRVFVNNASMGVYAKVVQSAEYRDAKIATAADVLPDILGPNALPLDLRFTLPSGEEADTAQLILVSNNAYELHRLRGAGTRARIDGGVLGVASVCVGGAMDVERLVALEAVGQVERFSGWSEWTTATFEVRSGGPVEIGVDGEALRLEPPLRFAIRAGALRVRLPRTALGLSPAARRVRRSPRETFPDLVKVVLGRRVGMS
jgi:diacylglycerol kinase family enzyme